MNYAKLTALYVIFFKLLKFNVISLPLSRTEVILSLQFRSYVEAFFVMIAILFALIGVLWGNLLTGHNLSMPSILVFISLAGIVVKDSILLVHIFATMWTE